MQHFSDLITDFFNELQMRIEDLVELIRAILFFRDIGF